MSWNGRPVNAVAIPPFFRGRVRRPEEALRGSALVDDQGWARRSAESLSWSCQSGNWVFVPRKWAVVFFLFIALYLSFWGRMAPKAGDSTLRVMALTTTQLECPFPELDVELSGVSLRETAYEILVAASGITAMSARTRHNRSKSSGITFSASKLKKVILRPKSDKGTDPSVSRGKKPTSTADIMRYQMEISEQSDDRIRKALMKAALAQVNKPVEAMLVPLELLLNVTPAQFADPAEYKQWRLRQLRVLEAGLVLHHPGSGDQDADDSLTDRLQMMLLDLAGNSVETGSKSEAWLALRIAAMAKAGRSSAAQNGETSPRGAIHWADGYPMNVHLYLCMLSGCFDTLDEAVLVDEIDEVMEWIRRTWGILGINPMLHALCFLWVLFSQFIKTGESEPELLVAAEEQMRDAAAEAKTTVTTEHLSAFVAAVSLIQKWAESRLRAYHDAFPQGSESPMAALLALELTASRILAENPLKPSRSRRNLATLENDRTDLYIRSSMRAAFATLLKNVDTRRNKTEDGGKPRPALVVLAEDVGLLARQERGQFSPVLKQWHLTPAGVAAAALHSCFASELRDFMTGTTGLSPDVVQILLAADQLETDLVQIAVEDGADADDGGKSLIREMPPYEAQAVLEKFSQKWVEDCVGRLSEWADRNVQNEQWNPKATREGYAPSAVEVLRVVDETMDAFYKLPISKDPYYVKLVVGGVDRGVQRYCEKTLSGCGKKENYVPSLPSLTRYDKKAFAQKGGWRSLLQRKTKISSSISSPSSRGGTGSELAQLCVRINTLHHIGSELQYIEKRLRHGWAVEGVSQSNAGRDESKDVGGVSDSLKAVRGKLVKGTQELIELASYRVVFHDLHRVFWEGLYNGGMENLRISQVIEQVDPQLGIIAEVAASEKLRNRIVAALMKACLDCFVYVLLAGGPSRAFAIQDADTLEEDLLSLKDLFKADGEGLKEDLVESAAKQVQSVVTLFHMPTDKLIQSLQASYPEADLGSTSGRYTKVASLPRTTGNWSPSDANTILRVLCHRADDMASKFLKKTFNLPKKLHSTKPN